jgi:hypothetical protein
MQVPGYVIIITIAAVVVFLIFLNSAKNVEKVDSMKEISQVKIGNATVKVELANTTLKRIKGLMFRKSLPENEGMLFIFNDDDYYSFWMMNVSFPIDMIWINSDYKVVHIERDAQPCKILCKSYWPQEKARYVLEVNANFTEVHGIKIGSLVKFE